MEEYEGDHRRTHRVNGSVSSTAGLVAIVALISVAAAFNAPVAVALTMLSLAAAAAVRWPSAALVVAPVFVALIPTYWAPDVPGTNVGISPMVLVSMALLPAALRLWPDFRPILADKIVLAFVVILAAAFVVNATGIVGSIASTVLGVGLPYATFRLMGLYKRAAESLAVGVVVGGVASAYIAIREYDGWANPFFGMFPNGHEHAFWARADMRFGRIRPEAAFGHAIALGMFLVVAALLAIALAWRADARKLRTLWLYGATLVIVFGLVDNLVRGPLVMLGLGVVLLVFGEVRRGRGGGRAAVLVLGVIVLVNIGSFSNVFELRDATVEPGRVRDSGEYRVDLWRVVVDPANFSLLGREVADEEGVGYAKAVGQQVGVKSFDNAYGKIYIGFGVLALVAFVLLGVFTARMVFVTHLSMVERAWAAALLAAFINLLTVDLLTQFSDLFWMALGLLAAIVQSTRETDTLPAPVTAAVAGVTA